VSVSVYQLTSQIHSRTSGTAIDLFLGESIRIHVAVYDASASPVNLAGRTLQWVAEEGDTADIAIVEAADITIEGETSEVFSLVVPPAVASQTRASARWALRDLDSGGEVLAHGRLVVRVAAWED
jgi:hypothetical protein